MIVGLGSAVAFIVIVVVVILCVFKSKGDLKVCIIYIQKITRDQAMLPSIT